MGKKENKATGNSKFSCLPCNKEFRYESAKIRHELSHTTLYECEVCHKTFNFVSALKRHGKQHNRNGSVECKECGKCFGDEILLKRHIKYSHKGSYTCAKCLAVFPSETALGTHEKTHRPRSERRYRCSYDGCDKSFNFTHHLKHHELTHSDTKQHYCGFCGKGFIQVYHLKSHLKNHEPEKWLPCSVAGCKKRYPSKYGLKRHLATHKSTTAEHLNGIMLEEKSEVYVLCPICGEFINAKKMAKHSDKCVPSNGITEHKDNSIVTLTEEDLNDETFVLNNETKVLKDDRNSDEKQEYLNQTVDEKHNSAINNCKTVLGTCLATDESNGTCLCDQITSEGEMYNEQLDIMISETTETFANESTPTHNKITDNQCEGCACSTSCDDFNYQIATDKDTAPRCSKFKDIAMPKIEYRSDGVIKLSETFDENIEFANNAEENILENDAKSNSDMSVLYNSCRAVLGNCIVSGNDTIGEGCICARMGLEAQQATAQEIDEITIEAWSS